MSFIILVKKRSITDVIRMANLPKAEKGKILFKKRNLYVEEDSS